MHYISTRFYEFSFILVDEYIFLTDRVTPPLFSCPMSSPLRFQIFPEACNRHINTRPNIYIKKQFVALVILCFDNITI